jgi:hypothetical protein
MKFKQWLEGDLQKLFPFMSEEDPLDWKKISRYRSKDSYVKAKSKGGRETEVAAEKVITATPNRTFFGKETLENLWNNAFKIPPHTFPNGQKRPEFSVALALLKNVMHNGKNRYRLLAYWEGRETMTSEDIMEGYHSIIGGIAFIDGYMTHAWVDKHWRGTVPGEEPFNLWQKLREFAKTYLGIIGPAPDDELTSKSFRASQAKHDYNRYMNWKQSH